MAAPWGLKYALHIVSSHFGELAARICECLLRRGRLSQRDIARFSETRPKQVKTCLLLLIQQNLVQAFTIEDEDGDVVKQTTEYIALFDNIIQRTRFPKFITVVSRELDKGCEELFEGLLQHGRLPLEKMIDWAKSGKRFQGYSDIKNVVRESLSKLVHARFVERCPSVEPIVTFPREENKKRKLDAEPETVELVLRAAAPLESKRFLFIDDESNVDSEKDGINSSDVGEKRKHGFLESDTDLRVKEEVLWRANYEEFLRRFRHKVCVENVRERLDDGGAIALSSMLEVAGRMENQLKTQTSVPVSINAIYEELMKAEVGRSMTLDDLRGYLDHWVCYGVADETYSADLKGIVELAQNEEVETIVLKKYGKDAHRIFRLLSRERTSVETDKISSTAFVDKRETMKLLYELWLDKYVQMEKIADGGNRQPQMVLWSVRKPMVLRNVENSMFHAALNLSLRLIHETDEGKELIGIPADKRVGVIKEKWDRLRNVRLVLEGSLSKLDDAIMLFHDF